MENTLILKSIYLNKYFLFFLIIIILTGNFNYFIPYFFLLFFHEIGHATIGILLGYKINKIMLYPLGGVTIFNMPINSPMFHEILILVMGPVFQIITYFILKPFFPFISVYHYTILFFNLLPLYPLDGGKLLNIISCYFYNYLISFKITFIVSIISLGGLFIYNLYSFNLNLFIMVIMLFIKIIKIYQKRFYYYERMLLERYLYSYSFSRIKSIKNIKSFYRDCYHYINLYNEKTLLRKYFESK